MNPSTVTWSCTAPPQALADNLRDVTEPKEQGI